MERNNRKKGREEKRTLRNGKDTGSVETLNECYKYITIRRETLEPNNQMNQKNKKHYAHPSYIIIRMLTA